MNEFLTDDDSELRLSALLYVLRDPALDRIAFEARMERDERVAEMVSEAVELWQGLRSAVGEPRVSGPIAAKSAEGRVGAAIAAGGETSSLNGLGAASPGWTRPVAWLALAALAASIAVVGFFGFATRSRTAGGPSWVSKSSESGHEFDFTRVVFAWSELQLAGGGESADLLSVSDADLDTGWVFRDAFDESDVPEWMVLATKVVAQREAAPTDDSNREVVQ